MAKYFAIAFVAIALCAFAPTPARADAMDTFVWVPCNSNLFQCGPQKSGPVEYVWQSLASPKPTSFCANEPNFIPSYCFSITAEVTRNETGFGPTTIDFRYVDPCLQPNCDGFINIPSLNIFGFRNNAWSGPDSSPTFIPGSYVFFDSDVVSPQSGTLNIFGSTDVPEPSTLLMSCAGLLGFAAIAFWRRQPVGPLS
jgi:hypothetical protein